jgi:hypothetical protein
MAKRRKTTPEEDAELEKRSREFREMLERRQARDKELAAEREQHKSS